VALITKRFPGTTDRAHKAVLDLVLSNQNQFWRDSSNRENMELIDKYYARSYGVTEDQIRARLAAIRGEAFRIQNFIAPIVLPQVESALGYLDSVFLTGHPIISVGAPPKYADTALSFATIIENNSTVAGWARNLHLMFRSGLKYSVAAAEIDWEQRRQVSLLNAGADVKVDETFWKGNVVRALDMYNTCYDRRVTPVDVPERGEFAGYSQPITACEMREYMNKLGNGIHGDLAAEAINSKWDFRTEDAESSAYYVPNINYDITGADKSDRVSGQTDWGKFFGNKKTTQVGNLNYSEAYLKTVQYVRIIPAVLKLFNVPEKNTPQIWKAVVINNTVVTEFYRVENAHGMLPILFTMPLEDNLGAQSLSFAEHLIDMQDLSSAFWNSVLESKRRAVSDRAIYNPRYLNAADVNNSNPTAKIPIRNATYNGDLSQAYFPIPYRDDQTPGFVQLADAMYRFSNQLTGNNPAKQGQFVKGNKTLREYEDVMGNSDIRNQMMALVVEFQFFTKLKEIVKLNTLQYQEKTTYVNSEQETEVEIDPVKLRQAAMFFKMSDGMVPADKVLGTEELTVAFQTMQAIPAIGADYRVSEVFAYLLKSRHVDLRPFKKSQAERQYEQQLGAWQQAAMQAAEKGAPFSAPMPVPPTQQQLQQDDEMTAKMQQLPLMQQVLAATQPQQQGAQSAQPTPAQPAAAA
jgi:hypothetical protein